MSVTLSAETSSPPIDPCWSRIGVRGDRTCPELEQHIHCRNCPTYSLAGRAILDAASPDQVYGLTSRSPAAPPPIEDPPHSLMTFRLASEYFGLPLAVCREVVEARAIHSLPHRRRGAVLGLVNVRGSLLICLSLSAILRVSSHGIGAGSAPARLLVMESDTGPLALRVDEVCGVKGYHPHELKEVPATLAHSQRAHTLGVLAVDQHTWGVLDPQRLLHTLARTLT